MRFLGKMHVYKKGGKIRAEQPIQSDAARVNYIWASEIFDTCKAPADHMLHIFNE